MGFLTKLLGPSLKDVGDLLGRFITDPDKKLEAQLALAKIESDFQAKLVDADIEYANAQAEVIKSEVTSQSWLARNWRPILMLVFTYIVAHVYIFAPIFSIPKLDIAPEMWELLKLGMGGYIVGRTVEKSATEIAKIVKK